MRHLLIGILMCFAVQATALERSDTIEGTIGAQIEAFQRDDFAKAFEYASPSIQGIFGSPSRFGAMVRQGYPMVWRPQAVEFGALSNRDGAQWQEVTVTDQAGVTHRLAYQMIETAEGWRINGVLILEQSQPLA